MSPAYTLPESQPKLPLQILGHTTEGGVEKYEVSWEDVESKGKKGKRNKKNKKSRVGTSREIELTDC